MSAPILRTLILQTFSLRICLSHIEHFAPETIRFWDFQNGANKFNQIMRVESPIHEVIHESSSH